MSNASAIIARLQLEPLPHEGGFFRRTYTSAAALPDGRPGCTAIYFLLTPEGFSALHTLRTDEIWHFHAGDPVEHLRLDPATGSGEKTTLGAGLAEGHQPQIVAPGGVWQGARLAAKGSGLGWALLGCTMCPGWSDEEFVLGGREALTTRFPDWAEDIRALTR